MRCLLCKKILRVRTTWMNLFKENNYYLCNDCTLDNPVSYTYVRYPFDNILAHVFTVFNHEKNKNPDAFILERNVLFELIRKKFNLRKCIFLYYNYFMDAIKDYKNIEFLAKFNKPIIIMCIYYADF